MNKSLPKIILIHGNGGSTIDDNWFPWVKKQLEILGFTVLSKTFPDNTLARSDYWLPFIKDELKADENTILIGHSSGAVAALRYAQSNRIHGSIIVAANYTDLGEETEKLSGYFDSNWEWNKIKDNQKWIIQFSSTDDPYIPIDEARFIHDSLETEYYEYTDHGHFGWDKKQKDFPELITAITSKLSTR